MHALCEWVLKLLKQYSFQKRGQFSVAATKQLRDDAATDTYRDLRALLKLLTQLTNRDLADFTSGKESANGSTVDVAQVRSCPFKEPPPSATARLLLPTVVLLMLMVFTVQVVFLGLEILVPLMSDEQLKYPKLARAYFMLLSYMLEVYPERVASCPGRQASIQDLGFRVLGQMSYISTTAALLICEISCQCNFAQQASIFCKSGCRFLLKHAGGLMI